MASAPSGAWDAFNYAPGSRTVYPMEVKKVTGAVRDAQNLVVGGASSHKGSATLSGNQSWLTLDFGVEVSMIPVFTRMYV